MSATPSTPPSVRPLSLNDVVLLNDEIQALIAAGIPLHAGLSGFATRVRGRLQQFSRQLAARVEAGTPLGEALEAESVALPGEYRVLIAAGMRSGRFDAALGSLSQYASNLSELRTSLRRAMIYPGVVCGLAYALLVGVFVFLVPEFLRELESLELSHGGWYTLLAAMSRTVKVWGLGIPGALLLMWFMSMAARWTPADGQGATASERYLGAWHWVPGVGAALRAAHWSRFAHLLSMLVEAGVPFIEAAQLCASAVGDRRLATEMDRVTRQLTGGDSLAVVLKSPSSVPPLLRWLLIRGEQESLLAPALREAAAQYAHRAATRAELVQRLLPMAVVGLVGGAITLVYVLTVFVPLTSMWRGLAATG